MSTAENKIQSVDNRSKRKRGKTKGRVVDLNALLDIRTLLKDAPLTKDLLIEHLHLIQDHFGHLSAANLVALAHEMKLATTEVYEVASFYHHFDVVRENDDAPPPLTVRVCNSVSCEMAGSEALITSLESALGNSVRVQAVPCVGRCDKAPVAVVGQRTVDKANPVNVKNTVDSGDFNQPDSENTVHFDAYRAAGGYALLENLLAGKTSAEAIISELDNTALRGLGGAGFPVGRKWRILKSQQAPRLMAVNIDEGEPGTFKDRLYMLGDPHRFLEGLLIAATVIGIDQCYLYIRDEYPSVIKTLKSAVEDLKKLNIPLPEILFRRGAGAYICGEESAMIESIEGKRGMPRLRPPYVAEVGLFGRPTLEHNCETLWWIRDVIEKGGEWFDSQGRNGRKGLRSFSVSGRVNNPGVHLAPAGISMRELIDEYCGGMLDDQSFYGYFPGGASGGILPASLGDIPLDFDTLQPYGCFIGSAAIIVLSDKDSARRAALNSMKFFAHESCGQCTPCRVGTEKAAGLMAAETWDIDTLNDLATVMVDASICGLGQAAPNPMLSVIKYFPHELGLQETT
ncbi:MAG: NADH:ubiquinone oxidoreductase subunit F (NADH-binding)/NADH:ubiquinone oxidoreductase subunit E [Gammaproteobacteria bacterium]|jgi:NADH:ubiquinone oxidoreductase subunit F (NADH-binding)/NADH:ubiquinone oxidoreductase subunit E